MLNFCVPASAVGALGTYSHGAPTGQWLVANPGVELRGWGWDVKTNKANPEPALFQPINELQKKQLNHCDYEGVFIQTLTFFSFSIMKYKVQIRNNTSEKSRDFFFFNAATGRDLEYYRTLERLMFLGETIAKLFWVKLYLLWQKIHELELDRADCLAPNQSEMGFVVHSIWAVLLYGCTWSEGLET